MARYKQFKEFQTRILVATNLFECGLNIERVNIIFNYDMPEDTNNYLSSTRMFERKFVFYLLKKYLIVGCSSWSNRFKRFSNNVCC